MWETPCARRPIPNYLLAQAQLLVLVVFPIPAQRVQHDVKTIQARAPTRTGYYTRKPLKKALYRVDYGDYKAS